MLSKPIAKILWAAALATALGACGSKKEDGGKGEGNADKPSGGAEGTEVKLCDNHTKTTIPAGTEMTAEAGKQVSDALMAQWKAKNPDREWVEKTQKSWTVQKPFDNSYLFAGATQDQSYGRYSKEDVLVWSREAELAATAGARVFHDARELGSTISVSCDMCHPDAANTHPETYPKYQVQLGRVVLLRDMINWCLEHPVRAKPMDADDPRMRAMEAYIYAQRKGMPLAYGKH